MKDARYKKKKLNMKRHNNRPEELIESEIFDDSIMRDIEKIKGIDVKKTPFETNMETVTQALNLFRRTGTESGRLSATMKSRSILRKAGR